MNFYSSLISGEKRQQKGGPAGKKRGEIYRRGRKKSRGNREETAGGRGKSKEATAGSRGRKKKKLRPNCNEDKKRQKRHKG